MFQPDRPDQFMSYDEASIRSLDWKEHIRLRPGMYIGKLGDGTSPDDGILAGGDIISHQTSGTGRKAESTMTGYRTPSWFRAKRNVELKQAKAKTSQPKSAKRKKRK